MKLRSGLFLILFGLALPLARGGPQYPVFTGEVMSPDSSPNFDQQLLEAYPLLQQIAKPGNNAIVPSSQIESQLRKAATLVNARTWPVVRADGKMPLPQVLISEAGINGGLVNSFRVDALSAQQDQAHLMAYAFLWTTLLDQHPQRSFEIMAEKARSSAVTSLDVLTVTASIGSFPGGRALSAAPSKTDWAALIQSANPCYRFLGLEYFDSVPQTPDELLSLYRQCLFGACSYMEARALTAINRRKDYREAVAKLLEEYAASNPVMDDGTTSKIRDLYRDRFKASAEIVQRIREHIAKHGEKPLTNDSADQAASKSMSSLPVVQPPAPKKAREEKPASPPSEEPTSSTPWSIIVVLIVVALGLLWLLVKNRK